MEQWVVYGIPWIYDSTRRFRPILVTRSGCSGRRMLGCGREEGIDHGGEMKEGLETCREDSTFESCWQYRMNKEQLGREGKE